MFDDNPSITSKLHEIEKAARGLHYIREAMYTLGMAEAGTVIEDTQLRICQLCNEAHKLYGEELTRSLRQAQENALSLPVITPAATATGRYRRTATMPHKLRALTRHSHRMGISFLTHGGDDYDHKSANRTRRCVDEAIIREQLDEAEVSPAPSKTGPTTFRVVVTTQVEEWYGDEDGRGRWKYKGGSEYVVKDGLTPAQIQELGHAGLSDLVAKARPGIERDYPEKLSPHVSVEYIIGWSLYGTDEETPDERLERLYG